MAEPSTSARTKAPRICLRDDVSMNDLIDDIAQAIDMASAINDGD